VREIAHFKSLNEAFDKPIAEIKHTKKHIVTKEEKAVDKEWDRKHAIYERKGKATEEGSQK
jgi:hypothetical protein